MNKRALLFLTLVFVLAAIPVMAGDQDGDGVNDAADNCRQHANRVQLDADSDGFGNRCDVDFNQSGVADGRDVRFLTRALRQRNPVADINEDGSVDWRDPIAAIDLWGLPPGPGVSPADDDGDGVPLIADACPGSIGSGAPGYPGCSGADLSLNAPRLIAAPAAKALRKPFTDIADLPLEYNTFVEVAEVSAGRLEQAAYLLKKGEACDGANLAYSTVAILERVRDQLADQLVLTAGLLGRSAPRPGGTPGEDWEDSAEFVNAMLPYWIAEKQFDDGLAGAVSAAADMQAVCNSEAGDVELNGTVVSYDPGAQILELEDGVVVAMAADFEFDRDASGNAASFGPGLQVEAQGTGFTDGSVMVQYVRPFEDLVAEIWSDTHCIDLQIAPYQLDPRYSGQPKEVHDARSYIRTGFSALSLEPGMALGVSTERCPRSDNPFSTAVHGARIRLTLGDQSVTLAESLRPPYLTDIPEWIPAFSTIQISVQTLRKDCLTLNPDECTATQHLGTTTWEGVMRPRGFYCSVDYERTEFALEGFAPNEFAVTRPNFLTVWEGPGRDNPTSHFVGLGWRVRNGTHGDQVEEVRMLEEFAVFRGDFRDVWESKSNWIGDTNEILGLTDDPQGIRVRPALIWPSLRGTQNGGPFRYSCRLPRVSRDVVGFCSGHGNAFWHYPVDFAGVGQGPNGSFSHTGSEAWDIQADTGTMVYAARAGQVTFARETEDSACDTSVNDPGDPECAGNGVVILHSDGTRSKYWHFQQNQVRVNEGDWVPRGAPIALSGNTGYSTGPHLHFETDDAFSTNAIDAWFRLWKIDNGLNIIGRNCYEPATGDLLLRAEP